MKGRWVIPPVYLLVALVVMVALDMTLPGVQLLPFPVNLVGMVPIGCGVALNILGSRAFQVAQTPIKPFERSTRLVTDGIFRWSRNPMYLGFVVVLCGVGLILGSLVPLMVIPVFVLLIERDFIWVEERMLAQQFRTEWYAYSARARRWL